MRRPREWKHYIDEVHLDITLNIRRTGRYSPGNRAGPPANCHDDEYDDERVIESIDINGALYPRAAIPEAVRAWLDEFVFSADLPIPEVE